MRLVSTILDSTAIDNKSIPERLTQKQIKTVTKYFKVS